MKTFIIMKNWLFLSVSACLLFSCLEEDDKYVKLPDFKPELVIHSFISPSDTIIYAQIGATRNVYGQIREYQNNLPAKVFLKDGENIIAFNDPDNNGLCSLNYPVLPGRSYQITAECQGFQTANATCSVPEDESINITLDTFTTTAIEDEFLYTFLNLDIKFNDVPLQNNYYNVSGILTTYSAYDTLSDVIQFVSGTDVEIQTLISDRLSDGKEIEFNTRMYVFLGDTTVYSRHLRITVLNTDYDYYRFHISQQKYSGSEDLFTEFSPIFTNVENGEGIFCSYVRYEKTLEINYR